MQTPGAAMSTVAPQLENVANVSSGIDQQPGGPPTPPGLPSLSARADTAITSGMLAGDELAASTFSLPAAAAKVIPALTPAWMAVVSTGSSPPERLMFTTSMS